MFIKTVTYTVVLNKVKQIPVRINYGNHFWMRSDNGRKLKFSTLLETRKRTYVGLIHSDMEIIRVGSQTHQNRRVDVTV